MADPYAAKVGLGSPDQQRLLWIVYGTETLGSRPPGRGGGISTDPVGTVYPVFWMVDDSTLKFTSSYSCGTAPLPR